MLTDGELHCKLGNLLSHYFVQSQVTSPFLYDYSSSKMNTIYDESTPPTAFPNHGTTEDLPHSPSVLENAELVCLLSGNSDPRHHDSVLTPDRAEGAAGLSALRVSPPNIPNISQTSAPIITAEQLQELIKQLTNTIKSNQGNTGMMEENLFSVAKSEFYISQGLSFKFDGDHERLAPWIKKFKALRANALWKEATYLTHNAVRYDILSEFTKIKETVIRAQAAARWTTDNQTKSLKPNAPDLFYPRILGKVVIGSITDDFYTTLQNYAGDDLACDGPMLLWLILTHFHTSTVTYQDKLKQQIRSRTLAGDHKDDIESYLLWLRHTLDVLTTTTQADQHSDLLNPIFTQLLTAKSTRFRRIIEDWHLEYHSEERKFTPTTLVTDADKKCKALRQSNQLYTTADTEIMALEANHRNAAITTRNTGGQPQQGNNKRGGNARSQKPAWYQSPPLDPNQTHHFDDRTWHWCPKCGEQGKWVCTHTPDKHQENYVRKRKHEQPASSNRAAPPPPPTTAAHVATALTSADIARIVAEQVSAQLQVHMASLQQHMTPINPDPTSNQPMDLTEW
jgi:hypothetical protein